MNHQLSHAPRDCPACSTPAHLDESKEREETTVGGFGPHDSNCVTGEFRCERGHVFYATTQYVCSCGWSGVKQCTVAGHDRVTLREDA